MKILFEREKESYNGEILTSFKWGQDYFYFIKALNPRSTNKFWKALYINLFLSQEAIDYIKSFENENDYYCFVNPQDIIRIYSAAGETE